MTWVSKGNFERIKVPEMSVGLVLEGGGTRGAYTSGVLDVFSENEIQFRNIYGVSAGACNALSYISGQTKRNFDVFYHYITDPRYLSVKSLRKTGSIFGFDFIFGELSHDLLPFDYEAYEKAEVNFQVGATDVETGCAVFFGKQDVKDPFTAVRASSSLPLLCKMVDFKGYRLLDGAVADPIPLERSVCGGHEYNVVVLTRDITYRKKEKSSYPKALVYAQYHEYPNLIAALEARGGLYNRQVEYVLEQERKKKAVVVRPSRPIDISSHEKDPDKLIAVYMLGVQDAVQKLKEIRELLKKEEQ